MPSRRRVSSATGGRRRHSRRVLRGRRSSKLLRRRSRVRTKNVRKGGAIGDIEEFRLPDVTRFKVGELYNDCYTIKDIITDKMFFEK